MGHVQHAVGTCHHTLPRTAGHDSSGPLKTTFVNFGHLCPAHPKNQKVCPPYVIDSVSKNRPKMGAGHSGHGFSTSAQHFASDFCAARFLTRGRKTVSTVSSPQFSH